MYKRQSLERVVGGVRRQFTVTSCVTTIHLAAPAESFNFSYHQRLFEQGRRTRGKMRDHSNPFYVTNVLGVSKEDR